MARRSYSWLALWDASFFVYFTVAVMFVVGVGFGAVANNALDQRQKQELITMLDNLVYGLNSNTDLSEQVVVQDELWQSTILMLVIWFLGLTVIGIPLIVIIVFLRGFVLGFAVGFLIRELAYRGMLIALVAILPSNLIAIPAIVLAGTTAVTFSMQLFRTQSRQSHLTLRNVARYTGTMAINTTILGVSVLVSGYLTPVFMRWIVRWLV